MGTVKRKPKSEKNKIMKKPVKRRRDPDETMDIGKLIREVIPGAEQWMEIPHNLLGGYKPKDLIGTDKEIHLRNLVRSIKLGLFS
jgi:hypothetical protein